MSLNISKGNMYDWVTHTWNTIKGACPHDCSYCYMKRLGKLNPMRLDESELETDLGINNIIFIGSSCDMFAENIPEEWILQTMNYARHFKNSYLYQSKNPHRMWRLREMFGDTDRICTTIETNRYYKEMGKAPLPGQRALWLSEFRFNRYLTIEPIMDFDTDELFELVAICNPVQVNIGADSGNNNLPEPSFEKVMTLIEMLKGITIVSKKRNLNRLLNDKSIKVQT